MAAAGDKARFYLEQSIPSLQEDSRKAIFTPEETQSIVSKRSSFEHTLNSRGVSRPSDYAQYATYEMNLDSLRKKRCKRLGVKGTSTAFSGQRTVFNILDRGTRKFPGDLGLWIQYIDFCKTQKAYKKLTRVFTNVLRLKPREYGLWVLAAKHFAETQGDMSAARGYMQRGLRFCKDERKLWLEYLRLEMVYLAKLAARRKILGLDGREEEGAKMGVEDSEEDMMMLPTITAQDIQPLEPSNDLNGVDTSTLEKLSSAPAFTGAIPIAIFDAAMQQFAQKQAEVAEHFFDVVAEFPTTRSTKRVLQHILTHLQATAPESVEAVICEAKMPLLGVEVLRSADFPVALGSFLASVRTRQSHVGARGQGKLAEKAVVVLLPFFKVKDELDEDVVRVLDGSVRRYLKVCERGGDGAGKGRKGQDAVRMLVERLRKEGREEDAEMLERYGIAQAEVVKAP